MDKVILTYVYHSGFMLETERSVFIFDYFQDSQKNGGIVLKTVSETDKQIYVLVSHCHPDHYNAEILNWRKKTKGIRYIVSKDVPAYVDGHIAFLEKGDVYEDSRIRIKAYGSTDEGISFYAEECGMSFFHAGDLNNWHWNEEAGEKEAQGYEEHFLRELADIKEEISEVDIAMFPVDFRLGRDYKKGAQQFVNAVNVKYFVPMHFGEQNCRANAFESYAKEKGCCFISLHERGQRVECII